MNIRPVSDLRNRYSEIEECVRNTGPVFLTKNGYGSMVVMSIDQFEHLNGGVEGMLDVADAQAATTSTRYSHEEVFESLRSMLEAGHAVAV